MWAERRLAKSIYTKGLECQAKEFGNFLEGHWGAMEGWRKPLAACGGFAEEARLKEETVQSW